MPDSRRDPTPDNGWQGSRFVSHPASTQCAGEQRRTAPVCWGKREGVGVAWDRLEDGSKNDDGRDVGRSAELLIGACL